MSKNQNGVVTYSSENNIGTIEFYHPKGNSLPKTLLIKLAETITKAGEDPSNQILVLRSAGEGAFCAGASFDELMKITNFDEGKEFFMGFAKVINAMRTCPKLILCRVHGKTVGGGIGIISAADFVVAMQGASIKLSELTLGIGPFVVGPAVGRKLGVASFTTLALDANTWYDAEWALSHGLFNKLTGSTAELDSEVHRLSAELAGSNPDALAHLKDVLWQATGHWGSTLEQRAEISGQLVLSEYTKRFIDNYKKGEIKL
ncbi:MAG: enoyl-CoA hydratase/isomerase family protein [Balneolaceae bacterium]|nr:MAG: enoyl-CoA hydratase/isomerase family protein [Balneolaceae bacterium]